MRSAFSNPPACMAPASMPESLAAIMQRMPATKPMPPITPPPGTVLVSSGVSRP